MYCKYFLLVWILEVSEVDSSDCIPDVVWDKIITVLIYLRFFPAPENTIFNIVLEDSNRLPIVILTKNNVHNINNQIIYGLRDPALASIL
jgi:hypothetical protein